MMQALICALLFRTEQEAKTSAAAQTANMNPLDLADLAYVSGGDVADEAPKGSWGR